LSLHAGRATEEGWGACRSEVDDWPRRAARRIDSAALVSGAATASPPPHTHTPAFPPTGVVFKRVCCFSAPPPAVREKDQSAAQLLF